MFSRVIKFSKVRILIVYAVLTTHPKIQKKMINIDSKAIALLLAAAAMGRPTEGHAHDHHIALSNETVHWGYFSKSLAPSE